MTTTALRSSAAFAPAARATAPATGWLTATARDFLSGLLAVTKAGLLDRQPARPRLRRL